jgi:hypothetical protein
MESPFAFGKTVKGENFINRVEERSRLTNNFSSGISTILISPRRYGKSSLVRQVAVEMQKQPVKFVFIDLFSVRNEEDFYKQLLEQTLKATISKQGELLKAGKDFFKKLIPVISFSVDPQNDLSVAFRWENVQKSKDEILNLPEAIALKKGFKIVVCIDEFQNIAAMQDSLQIEKELRSCWQHHQKTSYCLYGSKRHMMKDIFNTEERPFYRFGDMMALGRIEEKYWVEYIQKSFKTSGKQIASEFAASIANLAENHPYYVQQLSHMVWGLTSNKVDDDILQLAKNRVIETNAIFYKEVLDQLSNTQIEMLNAAIDGIVQFSSSDVMRNYKLGTHNNITKNKLVLENKDILLFGGEKPLFVDPFFKFWFKNHKFK